jgi:E3 ubiquitin-protein ligase BAH
LTFDGDTSVDASLSPDTREYLKALVGRRRKGVSRRPSTLSSDGSNSIIGSVDGSTSIDDIFRQTDTDESGRESVASANGSNSANDAIRRVEIPLTFDAQFFGLLQGDVSTLDALQSREQKAMAEEITELSKAITRLTEPSKFAKTDMYRWRALFDIYLQAAIFFSTREQDHGSRNSAIAAQQLDWFQREVARQGILQAFKLPASRQALDRFIAINITLLQNLKFQEINQKAIGKILKSKSTQSSTLDKSYLDCSNSRIFWWSIAQG